MMDTIRYEVVEDRSPFGIESACLTRRQILRGAERGVFCDGGLVVRYRRHKFILHAGELHRLLGERIGDPVDEARYYDLDCPSCHAHRPEEFFVNHHSPTGRSVRCKRCTVK